MDSGSAQALGKAYPTVGAGDVGAVKMVTWKAADGLLVEEIGSDALEPYGLKQRAWTVTGLEEYARCPYRFRTAGSAR